VGRVFGTDGVRGVANRDLTVELALDLSVAAAHVLGEVGVFAGHRPSAVVGRDPRASGEFLEAAVVAGLASAGVDVSLLGVVPTPAVAYLTAALGADIGVVISASHNPAPDNGIKFFARGGHKLDDDIEDVIEKRLGETWQRPLGPDVGRVHDARGAARAYTDYLLSTLPNPLEGISVVVDAANGAAFALAPELLRSAGAKVDTIGTSPDGLNINEGCGSTHLAALQQRVVELGADVGIALDGDADRILAVDASGEVVDGDQIMAVLAIAWHERGELAKDTVVGTVMSNLGFKIAMAKANINVVETAVGDRYVLEAMRAGGYALGGEQSGHVIMLDHATTGDGLLVGLHLLARMAETRRTMADLAGVMTKLPQVLINVTGVDKSRVGSDAALAAAVASAEAALGDSGRVLLRPSGTEEMVRVMVEATSEHDARRIAEELAEVVRTRLVG
jgi:phosphoglucosamine mutase